MQYRCAKFIATRYLQFAGERNVMLILDYLTGNVKYIMQPLNIFAHVFQACSIILFLICLTQKAYFLSGNYGAVDSIHALIFGIVGILEGIFAWYANPILFLSYLFFYIKRYNWSIILGLISLLLMASFFLTKTILVDDSAARVPIIGYGLGFWLWLGSSIASIMAACIGKANQET
jgi:hypothetical protein